jgi:carbamate kinase
MKIVVALGGNALGNDPVEQLQAVQTTAKNIVDLIEEGHQVIVAHGNGPQVGMIQLAFDEAGATNDKVPYLPLSLAGAMSQGYIGLHLQQAIKNELDRRGIDKQVASIITQTVVDANDEAFQNPRKPIGSFYSEEEAKKLAEENN